MEKTDEFSWLEPLRKKTREIQEETKRIREEKQKSQMEKVKFVSITRTIDDRKGIHYLDAVDTEGYHWSAEMNNTQEKWLVYQKLWARDPQQPFKNL